jgi:hypothetical protein
VRGHQGFGDMCGEGGGALGQKVMCSSQTSPKPKAEGHSCSYCTIMEALLVTCMCGDRPFLLGEDGTRGIRVNQGGARALFGPVLVGGLVPSCGGCLA